MAVLNTWELMSRKAKAWIVGVVAALVLSSGLGAVNTFTNTVSRQELCVERKDGREAVRTGFIATQGTLIRFAGNDLRMEKGYTPNNSAEKRFNRRASAYMLLVREDALKTFPPIEC